jgi:hypothetical protein
MNSKTSRAGSVSNRRMYRIDCTSLRSLTLPARLPKFLPVFLFLLLAPPLSAAEQEKSAGGAVARARIDRDAVPLSESLVLTISVEGRSPLEIERILEITPSPAWVVTPLPGPESTTLPKGRGRWQQGYRLSPLQNGEVALPLAPLRFRTAGSEAVMVQFDEFKVKVATVVSAPTTAALKDITPLERLPEPARLPWGLALIAAGVSAGLALVGWGAWRASRKPVSQPAELPPGAWALQELSRIEALNLPAAGQIEPFHTLLADVVRQYIDRRFGVRTTERTTGELLAALAQANSISAEPQETLRDFFARCDLAKFARAGYVPEDCQEAMRLARRLVEDTPPSTTAALASGGV